MPLNKASSKGDMGLAAIPSESTAPRFLGDAMLGGLVRWLRVLGCDTAYDPAIHDPELVALAAAEARVLLTRDRHLVAHLRPQQSLLITTDAPLAQLRQVVMNCSLAPPAELFTRCLVCNALLRPASTEEAASLLPDRARTLPGPVCRCPVCERMYWLGSHTRRMRHTLAEAFPEWCL